MNSHRHLIIVAGAILILLSPVVIREAYSQSTQITNGGNYLKTTQNADGSWGATPTSINGVFPTTIVALDALRTIEPSASPNQASAIAYLTAQELEVTP